MSYVATNDFNSIVEEKTPKVVHTMAMISKDEAAVEEKPTRGFHFWMCFASLITPTFLMALDLVRPVLGTDLNHSLK